MAGGRFNQEWLPTRCPKEYTPPGLFFFGPSILSPPLTLPIELKGGTAAGKANIIPHKEGEISDAAEYGPTAVRIKICKGTAVTA